MMDDADYHFSITLHVGRLDVLYALRGLAMYAQKKGNVYKPWKHAGKQEWKAQDRIVKMHFTSPDYREQFEVIARELLPGQWDKEDESNNEPLPTD